MQVLLRLRRNPDLPKVVQFFRALYRRNRLLTGLGWLLVVILAGIIALMAADRREVEGVDLWLRPLRYTLSLLIYCWTVAWIGRYVSQPRWRLRLLSGVIGTTVLVTTVTLLVQAARGRPLYYDTSTDFDTIVYAVRVAMVAVNSLMMVLLLLLFRRPSVRLPTSYLWSIRAGIVLFLFGSWVGANMLFQGSHSIGGPVGGAGLPLVGWNMSGGDLRVAHGLALHALQVLPLVGWAISRWRELPGELARRALASGAIVGYALLVFALYRQATAGVA